MMHKVKMQNNHILGTSSNMFNPNYILPHIIFSLNRLDKNKKNAVIALGLNYGTSISGLMDETKRFVSNCDSTVQTFLKSQDTIIIIDDSRVIKDNQHTDQIHYSAAKGYLLKFLKDILPEKKVSWFTIRTIKSKMENYAKYEMMYTKLLESPEFSLHYLNTAQTISTMESNIMYNSNTITNVQNDIKIAHRKRDELKKVIANRANMRKVAKRIENFKWIDSIKVSGNNIIVKTKMMQMGFVPKLYEQLPIGTIEKNSELYAICKQQFFGNNFIAMPMEITVDPQKQFTVTSIEGTNIGAFLKQRLMFHGVVPHFGTTGACWGQLKTVMADARTYDLDYLLQSLYIFLQSVNLQDSAGIKLGYLPLGTKDGKVTYWPVAEATFDKRGHRYKDRRSFKFYNKVDIANDTNISWWPGGFDERYGKDGAKLFEELFKNREPQNYELWKRSVA